jgi:predicted short-subunit dehydrogenase-like oxidoreductase (DUF2520 family)
MNSIHKQFKIGVIGAGRVGSNLAYWLSKGGWHISGIFDENHEAAKRIAYVIPTGVYTNLYQIYRNCDVAIFAVPDNELLGLLDSASEYGYTRVCTLIHTSGVAPSLFLNLAGIKYSRASMHPLLSVPLLNTRNNVFFKQMFGVEGDEIGLNLACELIADLNARPIFIDSYKKPIYHSAAVYSTNFIFANLLIAMKMSIDAGLTGEQAKSITIRMAKSTIQNFSANADLRGLTGPAVRGDIETLLQHLHVLDNINHTEIYKAMTNYIVGISKQKDLLADILD